MNENGYYSRGPRRRSATANLKRCPLCSALNAEENDECFVCSWSGQFDHDEDMICEALDHLIQRCPELAEEFTPAPALSPWERFRKRAAQWLVATLVRR